MTSYVAPGLHLLIDFTGAHLIADENQLEAILREAAQAAHATVLSVHLHSFGDGAGITGVAVLAESHITIHTWPENDYIALDIFMCGSCDPYLALDVLNEYFQPQSKKISEHYRGV